MHRIDGPGATVDHRFTDGDPVAGIQATMVTDDWANDVQEEIISVLADRGIVPVKGTQNQLLLAIFKILQSGQALYSIDTGSANTYVASFSPAITALTDGLTLKIKAKTANSGASTFNPDGLGVKPIVGSAHLTLQGGEIIANSELWLQWNSSIGAGSWVLIDSTGASAQVADATFSRHALALGQLNGAIATNGYIKIPVISSGVKRDFIIQFGISTGTTTSVNVTFPLAFPNAVLWLGLQDQGGNPNLSMWTYALAGTTAFSAFNIGTLTKSSSTVNASISANALWFAVGF
jgi:hypothetical protein